MVKAIVSNSFAVTFFVISRTVPQISYIGFVCANSVRRYLLQNFKRDQKSSTQYLRNDTRQPTSAPLVVYVMV